MYLSNIVTRDTEDIVPKIAPIVITNPKSLIIPSPKIQSDAATPAVVAVVKITLDDNVLSFFVNSSRVR